MKRLPRCRAVNSPDPRLSPEALAYLGDAIWELHVRKSVLMPPRRLRMMHEGTVRRVRATAQADLLTSLLVHLGPEEGDWVRKGRNAASGVPRNLDPATYRLATGFETLLGYLFLVNPERLGVVLALCDELQNHGPDTASPKI